MKNNKKNNDHRIDPTESEKIAVWAAAAGRCTFCNRYVLENEDLGEAVPIGELAHNVGWGNKSPRGESSLSEEERRQASNLILACRNCHKPIDAKGVVGRYTVERLAKLKGDHEKRIRYLTKIGGDRKTTIIRVVGTIRNVNPELTYDTVLEATTSAGLFPELLEGASSAEIDRDLRQLSETNMQSYFSNCADQIESLANQINDGVRRDQIKQLAVFAFARIPIMICLGAKLDDKIPTHIFQRQRIDDVNAWRWPANPPTPSMFETNLIRKGSDPEKVALLVNLSGEVKIDDLPTEIDERFSLYVLAPKTPHKPDHSLISSPAALANFDSTARQFLAQIEANHGKIDEISLFPAIPLSAAVTLGRVLMPNVSPAWRVYDRDESRNFFEAMEVRR